MSCGCGVVRAVPQAGREILPHAPLSNTADTRSLTKSQRKIIQAYADDVEGRKPDLAFLDEKPKPPSPPPPHPDKFSDSAPRRAPSSPKQETAEKKAEQKAEKKADDVPYVDPTPHHEGVGDKVAHVIGGAIGWAERLFGRLTKDKDEKK